MNLRNKKRLMVFSALFLASILPYALYKIVSQMSDGTVKMPKYYFLTGTDTLKNQKGETIIDSHYYKVNNFKLINQLGDTFDYYKNTTGKIVVAHLFFTTCTSTCPKLTLNAEVLQKAFKKRDSILRLVSITVDPMNDDVKAIRDYSQKRHANHDFWYFLTGSKADIYKVARDYLRLDTTAQSNDLETLAHSENFVLLDKNHHIRGFYNGLDSMSMKFLKDDIALLSIEKSIRK